MTVSKIKLFVLLFGLIFLTGCSSSKYTVLFDTVPQGASLVCNGKNYGYTPTRLYYDESVKSQSYLDVSSCEAIWVSGVRQRYPSSLTIFPQGSTEITLPRPNAPGYAQDAEFPIKLRQQSNVPLQTTCIKGLGVINCF
jgi:hypothetical protein